MVPFKLRYEARKIQFLQQGAFLPCYLSRVMNKRESKLVETRSRLRRSGQPGLTSISREPTRGQCQMGQKKGRRTCLIQGKNVHNLAARGGSFELRECGDAGFRKKGVETLRTVGPVGTPVLGPGSQRGGKPVSEARRSTNFHFFTPSKEPGGG